MKKQFTVVFVLATISVLATLCYVKFPVWTVTSIFSILPSNNSHSDNSTSHRSSLFHFHTNDVNGSHDADAKPASSVIKIPLTQNVTSTVQTLPSTSHELNKRRLLCGNFQGRLGNNLFQYASVLGLALRLKRIPVFGNSPHLRETLKASFPSENYNKFRDRCSKAKVQTEKAFPQFDERFLHLDPESDYRVAYYFQSWKYFADNEAEVKKALEFRDDVISAANKTVQDFRMKYNKTLIGVHVRRGDYLGAHHLKFGYKPASLEYFETAFGYMRIRFKNVTFIVSTDDAQWGREAVFGSPDVIIHRRQSPAIDMAVLSSLDHVITSVGTYSWWVGYFNRGVTIYYKDYIQPNTYIGDRFKEAGNDFIYPGWLPL